MIAFHWKQSINESLSNGEKQEFNPVKSKRGVNP